MKNLYILSILTLFLACNNLTYDGSLLKASRKNNDKKVQKILEKQKIENINYADETGNTSLIYAVLNKNKNLVNLLLKNNADINVKNSSGKTAAYYMAKSGNIDMLRFLINKGAYISERTNLKRALEKEDTYSLTVLLAMRKVFLKEEFKLALETENVKIVYLFLKAGYNLEEIYDKELSYYIKKKNKNLILLKLASKGLNYIDKTGKTALIYAIKFRDYDLIDMLLKNKVDLNQADKDGKYPVLYALDNDEILAKKLYDNGASLKRAFFYSLKKENLDYVKKINNTKLLRKDVSKSNESPLMYVLNNHFISRRAYDIARYLVKKDYSLTYKDTYGKTALLYAIENKHEELAYEILEKIEKSYSFNSDAEGYIVNAEKDFKGKTALLYAFESKNYNLIEKLISYYDNFEEEILYAIKEKHYEMIYEMLRYSQNINYITLEGSTILIEAVKTGDFNLVRDILAYGASKGFVDNKGKTAMDYAEYYGYSDLVSLLN